MYIVWLMLTKHSLTSGFKYIQNISKPSFQRRFFYACNVRKIFKDGLFHQDHTAFGGNGLTQFTYSLYIPYKTFGGNIVIALHPAIPSQ